MPTRERREREQNRPKAPRRLAARKGIDAMEPADFYRSTIELCERAIARTEPGTIAFTNTLRTQMEARKHLDEALKGHRSDPFEGLSEDEIRALLRREAEDMPDAHLAVMVEVYCERVGVAFPLRAVAGGAR